MTNHTVERTTSEVLGPCAERDVAQSSGVSHILWLLLLLWPLNGVLHKVPVIPLLEDKDLTVTNPNVE